MTTTPTSEAPAVGSGSCAVNLDGMHVLYAKIRDMPGRMDRIHIPLIKLRGTAEEKLAQLDELARRLGTIRHRTDDGLWEAAVWSGNIGTGAWFDPYSSERAAGTLEARRELEAERASIAAAKAAAA